MAANLCSVQMFAMYMSVMCFEGVCMTANHFASNVCSLYIGLDDYIIMCLLVCLHRYFGEVRD